MCLDGLGGSLLHQQPQQICPLWLQPHSPKGLSLWRLPSLTPSRQVIELTNLYPVESGSTNWRQLQLGGSCSLKVPLCSTTKRVESNILQLVLLLWGLKTGLRPFQDPFNGSSTGSSTSAARIGSVLLLRSVCRPGASGFRDPP